MDTCGHCQESFNADVSNTVVHHFTVQPWFSFVRMICPHCDGQQRVFLWPEYDKWLGYYAKRGCGVVEERFPSDEEFEAFHATVDEIRQLPEETLTPRQEHLIAFFAYLLERGDTA